MAGLSISRLSDVAAGVVIGLRKLASPFHFHDIFCCRYCWSRININSDLGCFLAPTHCSTFRTQKGRLDATKAERQNGTQQFAPNLNLKLGRCVLPARRDRARTTVAQPDCLLWLLSDDAALLICCWYVSSCWFPHYIMIRHDF